jgi:MoxR-like ATPase
MSGQNSNRQRHLLRELNLFGLDHLDPLILAALADARSLLLIGAHGTAKSELLNRLASALSLSHRHYNASLISFDDLLGYPVPNADRTALEYLRTPADLWDAESVFLDEISRCRPEHQNKLFSIVHERRVQGLSLVKLRYCWSAMNPPLSLDGEEDDDAVAYQGSLPLDPALADRFAYVATVPAFSDLDDADRQQVISRGGQPPGAWPELHGLIEETRLAAAGLDGIEARWIDAYVNALTAPLRDAGLSISGRRAVMLALNVRGIHAACGVLGRAETLSDAAYLALKWGLPQPAQGLRVREHHLAAAHREAIRVAGSPRHGTWQRLRMERDPVRRVALALSCRQEPLGRIELSQLVTDAWAGLTLPERYIFARNLLPALDGDRLTASTLELLLEPAGKVLAFAGQEEHHLVIPRSRAREWGRVLSAVARLRREGDPEAMALGNTLYTLFVVEEEAFDADALIEKDREWRRLFNRPAAREVA